MSSGVTPDSAVTMRLIGAGSPTAVTLNEKVTLGCRASLFCVHCAHAAETPYPSAGVMFSTMAVIP